ncbi:DUF928 domain-containing protein [Nostocaceae cyanobacterium CENA369]|uniref:DUF928 domain-containing protein n=1 Tax=Dendronalium phyllosphericum CENA369 TaxID=1725256 RepID=A0A8J7I8X4_9NOST|nr:DUF928 domain-containing protein [Dendronalium phyllosphericum]MBH8577015.1 DUF928 domain-containing protein [Dendronalium phyllosphericum CENA369]
MKSNFCRAYTPLSLFLSLGIGAVSINPQALMAQTPANLFSQKIVEQNTVGTKDNLKIAGVGAPGNLKGGTVRFTPPKVDAPENRRGGASRGENCSLSNKSIKALLPASNIGLTVEKYPTFFVYIPPTSSHIVEFELHEGNKNQVVYKTRFIAPDSAGVISFSLPNNKTVEPLQIGKNYRWFFTVICNPEDSSENLLVQGWVQRIQPSAILVNQLQKAQLRDRPRIYAQAGIWHETLTTLADLRYSNPQDSSLVTDWKELLKSVGLSDVAEEPFSRIPEKSLSR